MSAADPAPAISMPPLLSAIPVGVDEDPLRQAVRNAAAIDSGSIYWSPREDRLTATLVVIPDRCLAKSMLTVFAVACGLRDCLGALTPPETAVTHGWPNRTFVNGAQCGELRAVASTSKPEKTPTWLAVSLELELAPMGNDPGMQPGRTSLAEEGCGDLTVPIILPSWARHTLVWLYTWTADGCRPLLDAWLAHCHDRGQTITLDERGTPATGLFMGLGDNGDLLLKQADHTKQWPLTTMLEHIK